MTETTEAKQKICCGGVMMRITDATGLTVNVSDRCIASECMAWRETFRKATKEDVRVCDLYGVGSDIPTGGYCGLAGKP